MTVAPGKHVVVVDGSNLATEGRTTPSLHQLDEAVRAYAQEDPDAEIVVVVDASFEHRIDPSERKQLIDAELHGEVVSPPAGAIGRGDAFVLRIAERTGARVLSNDSFQEFHAEHPWLFDKGRLVGGKPVPGVGWIFTPRIPVRGPKSKQAGKAAKGQAVGELSPPVKAAELAKAAKKLAARRATVLPDGSPPKVGDVWPSGAPAGAARGVAKKKSKKAGEPKPPPQKAALKKVAPQKAVAAKTAKKKPETTSADEGAAEASAPTVTSVGAKKAPTKKATKKAAAKEATAKKDAAKKEAAKKAMATAAAKAPPKKTALAPVTSNGTTKAKTARSTAAKNPVVQEAIGHALAEAVAPAASAEGQGRADRNDQKRTKDTKAGKDIKSGKDTKAGKGTKDGKEAKDGKTGRLRRRRTAPAPAVNEPLAFITFVATYPLDSDVEGEVVSFTSHGAMVDVDLPRGGVLHSYIPLTAMGEPPPTKARQVLARGERRRFVLVALDPPRRVAELALPEFVSAHRTAQA